MPMKALAPLGPAPADAASRALWRYAGIARMGDGAHPYDWQRFYRFVVIAHVRRVGWDAGEVYARLVKYGITAPRARELAEIYWNGRCVLCVRTRPWRTSPTYSEWLCKNGARLC
jgi:hypothetical protein